MTAEGGTSAGARPLAGLFARSGPPSVHAVGTAAVGASLLCAAALLPLDAPPLSLLFCPFRAATGLPCLTCGASHAFHALVRGQVALALAANPLAALLALACALHAVLTLLRLCGLPFAPTAPALPPRALRLGALLLVSSNWAFVALRGLS